MASHTYPARVNDNPLAKLLGLGSDLSGVQTYPPRGHSRVERADDEQCSPTDQALSDVRVPLPQDEERLLGESTSRITDEGEDEVHPSLLIEWLDILRLALPMCISYVSWVGMKTTDTAILGHVGTRYLSAAALSDLYTSSSGCMLGGGVLSIFVSQAIGAGNKKLAGIWLQVSLTLLALLSIPIIALWSLGTYPILRALGEEQQLASDAAYYARTLAMCIPARVCFKQLAQYFQGQRIMQPAMVASFVSMWINFSLALVL
eukprot:1658731-Pyramimonas_sp.AAC.1